MSAARPIVGIDYTAAVEQGAGIGRIVREQVDALMQLDTHPLDFRLFAAGIAPSDSVRLPDYTNASWSSSRVSSEWLARLWHRARIPVPINRWMGPLDLFHAPDFVLPPVSHTTKTVVTVYDLAFLRVPDAAAPSLRRYLSAVVPRSLRRADHVIATSHATADDIVHYYDLPRDSITVVYGGVQSSFRPVSAEHMRPVLAQYGLSSDDYLLAVGTIQPRKNYARLVEAMHQLRVSFPHLKLIIVGGPGWLQDEFYATLDRLDMREQVKLPGYIPDAHLPILYSGAMASLVVSLYEGFGFPVLESMACATPVITSRLSSLPEVGGSAVAYIEDVTSVDSIASTIAAVVSDEARRHEMARLGLTQAAGFTWQRSAQGLLDVYRRVLGI